MVHVLVTWVVVVLFGLVIAVHVAVITLANATLLLPKVM